MSPFTQKLFVFLQQLQTDICTQLQNIGAKPSHDAWQLHEGAYGQSNVLSDAVIEKGGVNISYFSGDSLPAATLSSLHRQSLIEKDVFDKSAYEVVGLSLVLHPCNPHVPTCHLNIRFFYLPFHDVSWFGGGFDLTPYYAHIEDCQHWHTVAKKTCDEFDVQLYPRLKQECDAYFYLPHRQEHRGIGGLFFDYLRPNVTPYAYAFWQAVGNNFQEAYFPIVHRRMHTPYTESQVDFMHHRRGRYVEFNLVYDRGTLFGLQSQGRIESILMSLPSHVRWTYNYQPPKESVEGSLVPDFLTPPKNWV